MCRTCERKMIISQKILIMGLPGAGKTSLAKELAPLLNAVHFNADVVRKNINSDLGFSNKDRIEQARRMGWMCDQVTKAGGTAVADFICPTPETRAMFGATFTIWVDRIKESRFADTNALFVEPNHPNLRVTSDGSVWKWAEEAFRLLRPCSNPQWSLSVRANRRQSSAVYFWVNRLPAP